MLPPPGASKKNTYAQLPYYQKVETSNEKKLQELIDSGELEEFLKYKNPSLWEKLKGFGGNIFDVLQRGEYATAGAAEEVWGGDPGISNQEAINAAKRAGTEIFSGVAGLEGQKKTWGDVLRAKSPEYAAFAEEHPFASVATDLAAGVLGDPTTFIPASVYAKTTGKIPGAIGKGISKVVRSTEAGNEFANAMRRAFIPGEAFKRLGAAKGFDIIWDEKNRARGVTYKMVQRMKPDLDDVAKFSVPEGQEFVKVMYGDIPLASASERVKNVAEHLKVLLKEIGEEESTYFGKGTDWLLENYFPNNPKQFTDLMENAGEYLSQGYQGGLKQWKASFEKGKKITSGQEFLDWLKVVGVKDENLVDVILRNLTGRVNQSTYRIRGIRIKNRLIDELPEVFRKVDAKTVFSLPKQAEGESWAEFIQRAKPLVEPGNTLWMPAGNLRFFPSDVVTSKKLNKVLEEGGELTEDLIKELSDKMVGITSKVETYQVPKDIVKDIDGISRRMAYDEDMWKFFDKAIAYFKNTAIFSPFFHVRNTVSSTVQSFLSGMNPQDMPGRFNSALKVLKNGTPDNAKVMGKTAGWWREQFIRNGIMEAGFTGQQIGRVGQNALEKVFSQNRKLGVGIERWQRGALFIDRIAKGDTPFEAAKMVKKYHFDYGDLTNFEQTFMKRVMPFYAWTRNNVPLIINTAFTAPKRYKYIAQLKRAIAGAPEAQDNPDWWRDQDVWSIKGDKWAIHVGLPYTDINNLFPGASGSGPAGMTGPAGALYNTLTNYDPFRGRKIKEFKGETAPLIANRWLQTNPQTVYFVQSMLPVLKRYGDDLPDALINSFGEDPNNVNKLKALNLLIGVKILPQLEESKAKNRVYKLQDILRQYELYLEQQQGRGSNVQ